ncbi:cytochrome P450 [Streptomyces sp. NPDC001843]|uniref:cytochrome P450 n=1 Tax=Streptomyces sp. NPDC001843 TaxID=3364617 RepID=UPI0036B386DF
MRSDGPTGGWSAADLDAVDLDAVDLFDARFHAADDPHRVWAAMRRRAPLHRQELPDGRGFWSVTRYQDACRVLGNHREFTSERGSLLQQLGKGDAAAGKMLVATDPPRHGELRRPLRALFSGASLVAAEQRVRAAVDTLVRSVAEDGVWDVAEQAARLPMAAAAALMDLPEEDWPDLARWTDMAAAPEDPACRVGSSGATLAIAHHELFEYFAREARSRAGTEGEDLIRRLATMCVEGAALSRDEVVVNCYSVLLGANATTAHTAAGTVLALAHDPHMYRAVRENPDLVPALVEEGLRWTSAARSFLRHAVADVELSGGRVPAGDAVAVWVGSANRDETVFAEAERFVLPRADNRHIAFGYGPHYCLGAAVARMTLRILFEQIVALVEELEPAGPPRRLASNFVAGYTRLPVRTRLRARARSGMPTQARPL